ncbi:MAG: nitronate monooxygenase [Alphaproteobacteria bacterium HGW-Alphaproteobacteria-3]|nr:MAG: nitronate monooxygenase [Alphaproteobacteria bacterium HGW-Alphaproteobacteria-3]
MALPDILKNSLEIPVIGSPLFIVSGPELVIAQCKAGIVGSFPALNARPAHVLEEWITRIKGELGEYQAKHPEKKVAPFAVNQICHASNDRLAHDIDVCTKLEVPIIITSLRPPAEVIDVCAGAGGHAGTLSPFALVREVKQWFNGTVILSGALSDGWGIAGALAMGADLAYMGTRFVATAEANAEQAYKDHLIQYAAEDIVYSNLFTGVHGNYLAPSVAAAGLDPNNLPEADKSKMNFGSGGNMKQKAWKDIWGSGQGIGQIKDAPPVAELIERLKREYVQAAREFAERMPAEALTASRAAAE